MPTASAANDATVIALAYQRLTFSRPEAAVRLREAVGSVAAIYAHRESLRDLVPDIGDALAGHLAAPWGAALEAARHEIGWCEAHGVTVLPIDAPGYPSRLRRCHDAPIALYYRGTAALEAERAIAVVGTRQCTAYARDFIQSLMRDVAQQLPGTLIVSGLAYGVDVCAHREALEAGLPTVGCLAHGLDMLYPSVHRPVAEQMIAAGGLATEYPVATRPDRQNFLRRNRIIAGLADCTIVAESMEHGGSLVTARIAADYGREVFAVPGRATDIASAGCNNLLRRHRATMLTGLDDILDTMGWHTEREAREQRRRGIQTSLFNDLTPVQRQIVEALRPGDCQQNALSAACQLPINVVSATLFDLEMRGIVRALAGGVYHLIN